MLNSEDVYTITRFDMKRIVPGSVVLVLGARGTGKTTIIKELLYHMRHYHLGIIMVDTLDTAAEYSTHLPDTFIYNQYDPSVVEELIMQQERQIQRCKRHGIVPAVVGSPKFLILDDLGFSKDINKDSVLKRIYSNGRHFKLTTIVAAQYCMQVPKECRLMFDYVFTTYEKTKKFREQIYDQFDVGFPDENVLHKVMQKCTEDYSVMVLDKRSTGRGGLADSVFHYKAKMGRRFLIGPPELWDAHDDNFNPMYSNFKKSDITRGIAKKRQIRIRRVKRVRRRMPDRT